MDNVAGLQQWQHQQR